MFVAVALLSLSLGDADLTTHQDTLRAAGFAADGPGALAYLKTWLPDPDRQAALRRALRHLGDDDFDKREAASRTLRTAGPVVLADVRALLDSPDPEVKRRAREVVDQLEQHSPAEVVAAACAVIAATRPAGADAILLAFAPRPPDRHSEAAFLEAVARVGFTPAMRAALDDAEPLRRRAAVRALGAAADGPRDRLHRALADADVRVRFEAGRALVRRGDRAGLPVLVEALDRGDLVLARRAEELLWLLAREQAPSRLLTSAADRGPVHAAWAEWLREHGDKADLARALQNDRGWIVVADDEKIGEAPGNVRIFDLKGKQLYTLDKVESPSDVFLLAGGRLLVAEHWSSRVTERDFQGRVLWEHKTTDKPVVAQRLADGGTFIATYAEILEVDRSGSVRYAFRPEKGMLYGATKLPGGRILFINGSGDIYEADRTGTIVRTFKPEKYAEGAGYWASIEVLGPDRYLVALSGTDRVVEINGQGKILWEAEAAKPTYAQRLPDGTTLVSCVDAKQYVVLDKAGKTIQTVDVGGRPFRARRY